MEKIRIQTENSYTSTRHLSQGYRVGDLIFTAGIGPLVPGTNEIESNDIRVQTARVLKNLQGIVEAAGSRLDHVFKVQVFLRNRERDFEGFEATWKEYFPTNPPARMCIEASLGHPPKDGNPGMMIELSAIAVVPSN